MIWLGPDSTPGLAHALEGEASGRVMALNGIVGTQRLDLRGAGLFDTQAGAEHDDHEHEEPGHDHADPHTWLDPENAALWAGVVAERLAAQDAAGAETYRANAFRRFMENYFGGSPSALLSYFVREENVDPEELDRL